MGVVAQQTPAFVIVELPLDVMRKVIEVPVEVMSLARSVERVGTVCNTGASFFVQPDKRLTRKTIWI
jgi:hypothetical protein